MGCKEENETSGTLANRAEASFQTACTASAIQRLDGISPCVGCSQVHGL